MDGDVMHRISRARPRDAVEAVAVLVTAMRVEWSLRRRDLPSTARHFGLELASPSADGDGGTPGRVPSWAVRRAHVVYFVMRYWPYGDSCLRVSLVLGHRLASLSPRLFVGVRAAPDGRDIAAHAWLEVCGREIDPTGRDYLAFDFT